MFLLPAAQKNNGQRRQQQHHRRRQIDAGRGHGFDLAQLNIGAVAAADDGGADGGADDHGQQHSEDHADALKMADLALRGPVPDIGAEGGGHHHVAAHHHRARDHHAGAAAHKIHAHKPRQHDESRRQGKAELAHFVDKAAGHHADHGGGNEHHAQNNGIVADAQIVLDVDDQIGEEHLHRHGEQAEGGKGQVQIGVCPDHGGPQAVEQVFEIAVPAGLKPRLILHQKDGNKAHKGHRRAENAKKFLPSPLLGQAVEQAEDDQHGDQRQDGQHALHPAPVALIGHIGDIGVEGSVVGGAAEEGHHAVQHHHHMVYHQHDDTYLLKNHEY